MQASAPPLRPRCWSGRRLQRLHFHFPHCSDVWTGRRLFQVGKVAAASDDSLQVRVVEALHKQQQATHEQRMFWWLSACSPGASALIDALQIPRLLVCCSASWLDNSSLVPMDCYAMLP
uniref:Uncharacterized protein n=1 Tax=Arundo donax TaxID=35708 RepID=A0A0A9DS62_ARUDO